MRKNSTRYRRIISLCLSVVMCVALLGGFAAPIRVSAQGGSAYGTVSFDAQKSYTNAFEVLKLTNENRAANNLPALKMDKDCMEYAMQRACEIAIYFSHTRPSGQELWNKNYVSGRSFGENISAGYSTPKKALDGWMNSPGHRANILNDQFTKIGVGAVVVNGVCYWVQVFGSDPITEASSGSYNNLTEKAHVQVAPGVGDYSMKATLDKNSISGKETAKITVFFYNTYKHVPVDSTGLTYTSTKGLCSISDNGVISGLKNGTDTIKVSVKNAEGLSCETSITVSGQGAQTEVMKGDVNGDKQVNLLDLRLVLRHICGKGTLNASQMTAGDLDGNGKVDLLDLRKMLRFICGKISSL